MVVLYVQTMKVKLQTASATDLPAYNPILPPSAITQVMLIASPQDVSLHFIYNDWGQFHEVFLPSYEGSKFTSSLQLRTIVCNAHVFYDCSKLCHFHQTSALVFFVQYEHCETGPWFSSTNHPCSNAPTSMKVS